MEEIFLDIVSRNELGRSKLTALRRQGFIPAVIYSQGKKTEPVKILGRDFLRLLHERHLESVIINLRIQGEAKKAKDRPCLIKEIQYDPLHDENVVHVDFNQISLTKVLKVNVGVEAKGEPQGVKVEAGVLEHILWELEIECLPSQIPEKLEVDVTNLRIGDVICVKDIQVAPGIKILNDPQAVVLSVTPPAKEEVAVPLEEEQLEPEVISEKKKEAEEAQEGEKEVPSKEKTKTKEEK